MTPQPEFAPLARAVRRLYLASRIRERLPEPARRTARRGWLVLARRLGYPVSSPRVPRPPLPNRRERMRLTHVVLSCDLNPDYLDFWPATRRAWAEIVGIEALLVLVAPPAEIPVELAADPAVIPFEPVQGAHPLFQSQAVRLLYPALVETDGAVLVADIDLFPLNPSYFHAPIAGLDARFFVSYRDTRLHRHEVPIAYNAAARATWAEIFDVASIADARARLGEWGAEYDYVGIRGEPGWYADQQVLYARLAAWPAARERLWLLDDDYTRFRRLDRLELVHEDGLEARRRRDLLRMRYSDYNCLVPYAANREVNELVLQLALQAARRRARRHGG